MFYLLLSLNLSKCKLAALLILPGYRLHWRLCLALTLITRLRDHLSDLSLQNRSPLGYLLREEKPPTHCKHVLGKAAINSAPAGCLAALSGVECKTDSAMQIPLGGPGPGSQLSG